MKTVRSAAGVMSWFDGFAGISRDGVFGGAAAWIDKEKPPGHTSLAEELSFRNTLKQHITLQHFFFSPNLVWFLITLSAYIVFPYDMESAAKGFAFHWVAKRVAVIFAVASVYYGFFWWALYIQGLAERKYKPGCYPTMGNMVHNLWYWSLGVLQWSLSDVAMTRLWASGAVPYVSDAEVFSSPTQFLILVATVLAIPLWRDTHFYFVHRFSHIRAVYKYVHSLHHRNTDPEPFSGLTMHPVEHLVYYSNVIFPTILFPVSPLVYSFMFFHLGLAPACGHSGFEDHWHSDQYHYIHHSKFECNYGSPASAWIDVFFGTFREKLGNSGAYSGEYKDDYAGKSTEKKVWSAQGYLGLQEGDHMCYTAFCIAATVLVLWGAVNATSPAPVTQLGSVPIGTLVGAVIGYGPVVVALLLSLAYDKMNWRWPFHKERLVGAFGFFVVMGWAVVLLPIYKFTSLLCTP
jgi:sterol desaturase/sphingolipid hydroxylase (fatty acid hydroxylase superfamily)